MIKKKTPLELKNKGDEVRKRFDNIEEDEDLLKQSSIALQQKAKVYEELSSGKLDPADHRAFLVRFDKNSSEDVPPICSDDVLNKCEEDADECYDTDEELDTSEKWVTYTDCLGRTRQCMAKDLEHIKRNDKKLREVVEKKRMQHGREEEIAAKSNEVTEKNEHVEEGEALPEMMSDQLRNEILRKQWEKDEERLKDKKDVHYQDVLFGGKIIHPAWT
ncbi:unnamed protein product [Acanthoscelides obtectus]|nr:unnamed protein product [Acanthoscelides obtectus]CAK1623959.1 Coiled-coil domain-containing protein 174 [Acanthoscelides obtectus]